MAKARQYTVSDGRLILTLTEAAAGGFVVKSPLDPDLLTQAESIGEAFANARALLRTLEEYRASRFHAIAR